MTECNDAIYLTFQHRIQVPHLHMRPSPHHISLKVWYLDSIDNLNNDLVYLCSRGPLQPLQCTGSHYHYSRLPMVQWCHSPVTTANCCPVPSVHTNNAVISFLKFAAPTNTQTRVLTGYWVVRWVAGCCPPSVETLQPHLMVICLFNLICIWWSSVVGPSFFPKYLPFIHWL